MATGSFSTGTVGSVDAGAASTVLLAANSKSTFRCIKNVSNADVFLNFGAAAEVDKGYVLAARAATKEDSCIHFPFHGVMFRGAINGISAAGGKACRVCEG